MNHSKFSKLLAAVTAFTLLGGILPDYQWSGMFPAYAEEPGTDAPGEVENDRDVIYASTMFDLNGGSLNDDKFIINDNVAVLKDENDSAYTPQPEGPALSGLEFAGWTDTEGNVVEQFEADTTYYASWNYGYSEKTNPNSGLVDYVNHGNFYDFKGNNGSLNTTYADYGYDILYKIGNNRFGITHDVNKATFNINGGLVVTPVFSFCDCYGNISDNPEDNLYTKVSYYIQNRTDEDIDDFGLASTADVQLGGNDRAAIYAYSDDDTCLTPDNCANYHVKNLEMRYGGNIILLSLPEDANCWWGYYGERSANAWSDHTQSDYNIGYDSGIAYSWSGLKIPAGTTIEKSVIFAVGDFHLFKTHAFNADGVCIGGDSCPLKSDHTNETSVFFQKPQSFSENDNIRYEVRNAGQLMWLAQNINSGVVANNVNIDLVNDIAFNMNLTKNADGSYEVSDNLAWTPIVEYSGVFDGKNHKISGIYFNSTEAGGLFNTLNGATVKNFGVENSVFVSTAKVGSIAASAIDGAAVQNVYSTASVSGDDAAGLLNEVSEANISSSYFAGTGAEKIFQTTTGDCNIANVFLLTDDEQEAYAASKEEFANGRVAYAMGSAWSQDLENDEVLPYLGNDNNVYCYTENLSCSPSAPQPLTHFTNDSALSGRTITVEHELVWGRVVKQANCTENERWNRMCANCEYETEQLFDRGEDGQQATGHNHDASGYCQNIDPNTGRKCNHYDAAYTTTPTTTTTTTALFSPTVTEYVPDLPDEQEQARRLNIDGELTVTPMTPEMIEETGVDISLEDDSRVFNYEIEMIFEAEKVDINKYVVVEPSGVTLSEYIYITPPNGEPILIDKDSHLNHQSEPIYIPSLGAYISHFETDNVEMYMITYGNSKWLKEFYDVQLIVINKSNKTMENCNAVINVPEGLTLCNSNQSWDIGDLSPNDVKDMHWYLRGDKAGCYTLDFKFAGESNSEEFERIFCSRSDIHVYAGDALKKIVETPGYYSLGEPYPVKITLKNVSDKPIYDLEHKINNINEGSVSIRCMKSNGTCNTIVDNQSIQCNNKAEIIHIDELLPGESYEITVVINDVWDFIIEKELKSKNLSKEAIVLRSLINSNSWMKSLDFCSDLYNAYLSDINTAQILKSVGCSTLECSDTEIPYEVIVGDVSDELKERNSNHYFRIMSKESLPFCIDTVTGKIDSNAANMGGKYILLDYDQSEGPTGEEELSSYEKFLVDLYTREYGNNNGNIFHSIMEDAVAILTQPDDSYSATVEIRDENGNKYGNIAAPIELSLIEGDNDNDEDGRLVVNGDAVLGVKPLDINQKAIIRIEYDNDKVIEYPIQTVESHTCNGDFYAFELPANDKNGVAVQVCEECGSFMSANYIPNSAVAMLSNGECYQDVRVAIADALATDEPTTMTLFGDINITTNVTIPSFITTIVAPGASITVKEGYSFVSDGEVKNFSGKNDCGIMVNILLNYWEGRTELMRVPVGTVVDSLPNIGNETCPLLGWYADDAHDEEFEPFTAGEEARAHIYWADIHHDFNAHGKCQLCGELHNGRDAFTAASVSVGGELMLNLKVKLSPSAYADKNAIMQFEFEDGSVQTVKMTNAKPIGDDIYTFACKIDPLKMSDNVRAQIFYSDGVRGTVLDYSLYEYFNNALAMTSLDTKSRNMIISLMNYGGYLQKYSGQPEEKLINRDLNMPLDGEIVTLSDVYNEVVDNAGTTVKANSASITFDSLIKLNIKFKLKDGASVKNYRFTINGKKATAVKKGDLYVVSSNGISPLDFDEEYVVRAESVSDPSDYAEVHYCVYTYVKRMLEASSDNDLWNLLKAVVKYGEATEAMNEE